MTHPPTVDTRSLMCDSLEDDITALMSWGDDMPDRTPNASAFKARIRASVDSAVEAVASARLSMGKAATFRAHIKDAERHLRAGEDERTHALMLIADAGTKQSVEASILPDPRIQLGERVLARMRKGRRDFTPFKEYMREWLLASDDQLTVVESKTDPVRYVVHDHKHREAPKLIHGEQGHRAWSGSALLTLYSRAARATKKP